ncbi:hypothetical protein [Pontibacter kalidii]|uniref:hypothetical protein n=1 Tax=Pontibacter kalidii TaxID=2592049 RepID=UPI00225A3EF8|nr:hypothetical protein [Pontibacter kalidii]
MGKKRAVMEVVGLDLSRKAAQKYFINVYEYMLYNDYESFMLTLDFRAKLEDEQRQEEAYHLFKFMLKRLLSSKPQKLLALCPPERDPF